MEDLWCFNDERVVEAIVHSRLPVVSAVGHETDFTLADFAADRRAPTPSAAAELLTPCAEDLEREIAQLNRRVEKTVRDRCELAAVRLEKIAQSGIIRRPEQLLDARMQRVDFAEHRVLARWEVLHQQRINRFLTASAQIEALNPLKTLSRGYAVVRGEDGAVLRSALRAREAGTLNIQFADGEIQAAVQEISDRGN